MGVAAFPILCMVFGVDYFTGGCGIMTPSAPMRGSFSRPQTGAGGAAGPLGGRGGRGLEGLQRQHGADDRGGLGPHRGAWDPNLARE